jgi:hypothetical protein
LVLREKDQEMVPEALEKVPPSTETWTEEIVRPSEATPETEIEPETVAPLEGEEIETEGGAAVPTVMLKLAEAEAPVESLTETVKGKEPATEGVPEIAPAEDNVKPVGSVPLERLQL